jgi:hypothetical protein
MAKKDWINSRRQVKKFQQGGAMAPGDPAMGEAAAPAPGAEVDAMLAEYAQTRDPQLAVAICDMLVELVAGTQPQPAAPGAMEGAPMARHGMKLQPPVFKK